METLKVVCLNSDTTASNSHIDVVQLSEQSEHEKKEQAYKDFLNSCSITEIPMILNGKYFKIKNIDSSVIIIKCECQLCINTKIVSARISCTSNLTTHLKVS